MTPRDQAIAALSALYGLAHTREGFRALPDGRAPYPHATPPHPAWHSLHLAATVCLSSLDATPAASRAVTDDAMALGEAIVACDRLHLAENAGAVKHLSGAQWKAWAAGLRWVTDAVETLRRAHL